MGFCPFRNTKTWDFLEKWYLKQTELRNRQFRDKNNDYVKSLRFRN